MNRPITISSLSIDTYRAEPATFSASSPLVRFSGILVGNRGPRMYDKTPTRRGMSSDIELRAQRGRFLFSHEWQRCRVFYRKTVAETHDRQCRCAQTSDRRRA